MDDRLDAALHDLARHVEFPSPPDLREPVAAAVRAPVPRTWWPGPLPRALALAVAATLLLAAAAAALVLVLPGLRISTMPAVPTADAPDEPLAVRLALGTPVSPDTVAVAIPAQLGIPDEAYVLGVHEVLTLVYGTGEGLPELGASGIGLLVQRIDGALDRARVEKLVAEVGATVTAVEVDGASGFWIAGPPHLVRYTSAAGEERAQATRLAGDTLVWERDGVLYRVESGLGMAETMAIAESMNP